MGLGSTVLGSGLLRYSEERPRSPAHYPSCTDPVSCYGLKLKNAKEHHPVDPFEHTRNLAEWEAYCPDCDAFCEVRLIKERDESDRAEYFELVCKSCHLI